MKDSCQFLEPAVFARELRCAAGVNFASVGPDREVCRVCPLAELGDLPLCLNVDVYTYLKGNSAAAVEGEFACLTDAATPPEARCARCPDRARETGLPSGVTAQPGALSGIGNPRLKLKSGRSH